MSKKSTQEVYSYINNYQRENYDRITILRKPGDKEKLTALARQKGFNTVTQFINSCIDEKLKRMKINL